MSIGKNRKTRRSPPRAAKQGVTILTRDEFAKISEVEGIRLTADMKQAMAEFDRKKLSSVERRDAIIGRFRRGAK
jgi:hypothetical protein